MQEILTLIQKDFKIELRKSHQFLSLILYVAATVFTLYLANENALEPIIWISLFWVVQLFIITNNSQKAFISESKNRMIYFVNTTNPQNFIIAKQLFQWLLNTIILIVSLLFFNFFLGNPFTNYSAFIYIAFAGTSALSFTFTLISAISNKAQNPGALIAILGFPIVLPLIMILIRLSKYALGEIFKEGAISELSILVLFFNILILILSIILYPFLWKD